MTTRISLVAVGSSSAFSLTALAELLRSINWGSLLAFVGSAVATGISWYVAARQARRDEDRRDRDGAREARIADMLAAIHARDSLDPPCHTMPAADLARPHSEGS